MNSNEANEWTAAKNTMTFMVFGSADRREDISESVSGVEAPTQTPALWHLLVIDFDTQLLQRMITCGFNG